MIDLHSHILPGVDDGPRTVDEALALARAAVADGIQQMAATPHWSSREARDPPRAGQVEALQRELNLAAIPLTLYFGIEVRLDTDLLEWVEMGRSLSLNGSRYVLIELPATDYPLYTDDVIFHLQLQGLVPVLAHPERNAAMQTNPDRMARLAGRGVLGQLTGSSLLDGADRGTRRTAEMMLKQGWVHVLATDAHDDKHRAPCLSPAVRSAARLVGQEAAQAMVNAIPAAILADQDLGGLLPERSHRHRRGLRWPWQAGG